MARKEYENCLVLGGGAARGFAHIGVIQALEEAGFRPDLIVGCSMGALVGLFYADGVKAHIMRGIARTISGDPRKAARFIPIKPSASGLFDASKIETFLEDFFGARRFSDLGVDFACVAVDIEKEEELVFTQGLVVPAIRASISIPGIFKPVRLGNRVLVDGGVLDPVPVKVAKKLGAKRIVAVNVVRHSPSETVFSEVKKPLPKLKHKMLADLVNEISHLTENNIFSIAQKSVMAMQSALVREIIASQEPDLLIDVPMESVDYLEFHKADQAVEAGYKAGKQALKHSHFKA